MRGPNIPFFHVFNFYCAHNAGAPNSVELAVRDVGAPPVSKSKS